MATERSKIRAIGIGWGKWLGLLKISKEAKAESERRLKICEVCVHAKGSKFLEFINGKAEKVDGMFCNDCFCPCHQKSLTDDTCRLGFWDL